MGRRQQRGGLTLAQKKAAGGTIKPANYALKNAAKGEAPEKLGSTWQKTASATNSNVVGKPEKSGQPVFGENEIRKYREAQAFKQARLNDAPPSEPEKFGPFRPRANSSRDIDATVTALNPYQLRMKLKVVPPVLYTLAYPKTAKFDGLGYDTAIPLNPVDGVDENTWTFMSVHYNPVWQEWEVQRHFSNDGGHSFAEPEVVYAGHDFTKLTLYRMLVGWSNGAHKKAETLGLRVDYMPENHDLKAGQKCGLVLARDAWSCLQNKTGPVYKDGLYSREEQLLVSPKNDDANVDFEVPELNAFEMA